MQLETINLPVYSVGSIDKYIKSVNRIPMLTPQFEQELAGKVNVDKDKKVSTDLIESHLRLVVKMARGFAGYGLTQEDLIQEGNIGLLKAAKRFDPSKGVRFVTFAIHWIRAEMQEFAVRNVRMVKIATTASQRKLFFNLRRMTQDLHGLKPADISAIAKKLDVSERDVIEMEARFAGHEFSADTSNDSSKDDYAPLDYLPDDEANEPSMILETSMDGERKIADMFKAMSSLDDRSRRIIEARWLCEEGESTTLHDLAAEFNVSAERVRQIEELAMGKMRKLMEHSVIH